MPSALVRLTQTDFNESFRKIFTSHLPVRWPHLTPLIRTLTTGHFRPDAVTMPGGFQHNLPVVITPHRATALTQRTAPVQRVGDDHTATSQVAVQNPNPLPHLQVGPGFRLRQSMDQSTIAIGTPVPPIADGHLFCLSYHLKGVCNSNYGGRHAHIPLSLHEWFILSARKYRLYTDPNPVIEIASPPWTPGGGSVGNTTLPNRRWNSKGSCGTRSRYTKT